MLFALSLIALSATHAVAIMTLMATTVFTHAAAIFLGPFLAMATDRFKTPTTVRYIAGLKAVFSMSVTNI